MIQVLATHKTCTTIKSIYACQFQQTSNIGNHVSFKEVLDRLLLIVSYPVRQMLTKDTSPYPTVLVANTCSLLATIVSELAATATGLEVK